MSGWLAEVSERGEEGPEEDSEGDGDAADAEGLEDVAGVGVERPCGGEDEQRSGDAERGAGGDDDQFGEEGARDVAVALVGEEVDADDGLVVFDRFGDPVDAPWECEQQGEQY